MSSPAALAVFLGGGAVGSYVGGMLASAGARVVLIDGWPEHVEAIRARGLAIASPEGEIVARPEAWHLADACRLRGLQPGSRFLAAKLYDTEWSAGCSRSGCRRTCRWRRCRTAWWRKRSPARLAGAGRLA